jgi:hypothetical protein
MDFLFILVIVSGSAWVLAWIMIQATRRLWLPEWFYAFNARSFRRGVEAYKKEARAKAAYFDRAIIIQTMQAEGFERLAAQKREKNAK